MELNKMSLGLTGGLLWGIGLMILTLVSLATGYAQNLLGAIVQLYPGYTITAAGSFIGLIYGFLDAFIGLYIFAWLYNLLEKKMG